MLYGAVSVRDGNERDAVGERRAVGAVVAHLDRDGTPPAERLAEFGDGRGVGPRALEPTQVVALQFRQRVPREVAGRAVGVQQGVVVVGRAGEHDAERCLLQRPGAPHEASLRGGERAETRRRVERLRGRLESHRVEAVLGCELVDGRPERLAVRGESVLERRAQLRARPGLFVHSSSSVSTGKIAATDRQPWGACGRHRRLSHLRCASKPANSESESSVAMLQAGKRGCVYKDTSRFVEVKTIMYKINYFGRISFNILTGCYVILPIIL